MLGGTLILAGGAVVMSFPKIVDNSILRGSKRSTDPVYYDEARLVQTYEQDQLNFIIK
jgi:hypothetical protein